MSKWTRRAKLKLKLASPVGVTLSNSETKMLLEEQQEIVETLKKDEKRIEKTMGAMDIDVDEAITKSSQAINMARATYMRTKNPILKREWARRLITADRTTKELVSTKKRVESTVDRLRMIAGDMELEMMAAEARAAETEMYVEAGDVLRLAGDKLVKARAKAKPMKIEYENLEISMEGAEKLVADIDDDKVIEVADELVGAKND